MRRFLIICAAHLLCATFALAEPRSLTLTNHSGETITAVTVVDANSPSITVAFTLAGSIPNMETEDASVDLPEGTCLVTMTYNLESGKILTRDIDLCSVDGIIVS
jgi:hypothetical protein